MKKICVLLMCLLVTSGLWAQKNPAALTKATEASRAARTGKAAVTVPQVEQAVKTAAADAVRAVAGEMSTVAYFHRLGNMEFWRAPSGQSLEQIERAARALGMTEYNVKSWPADKLEEFITTVTVFSNVANYEKEQGEESFSRDDTWAINFLMKDRNIEFTQWVIHQPDFYPDNYIPLNYREKFHPDVKSLRVLLVSDDIDIISRVRAAERTRKNVQVDVTDSVGSGIKCLENAETKYDIIASDYGLAGGARGCGGYEVSMYVWNKKLHIPVVLLSNTDIGSNLLILHNIVGQSFYLESVNDAQRFLNYLSNIVAMGKAYPNSKQGLEDLQDRVEHMNRLIEQEVNKTILPAHYSQRAHLKKLLGDEADARADEDKANELYDSMQ